MQAAWFAHHPAIAHGLALVATFGVPALIVAYVLAAIVDFTLLILVAPHRRLRPLCWLFGHTDEDGELAGEPVGLCDRCGQAFDLKGGDA